jgi:hypothetical protein
MKRTLTLITFLATALLAQDNGTVEVKPLAERQWFREFRLVPDLNFKPTQAPLPQNTWKPTERITINTTAQQAMPARYGMSHLYSAQDSATVARVSFRW